MDILLLVLGFLLGALLVYFFMGKRKTKTVRFDATIILEKIKSVSKLITVEGNYSEVIHYNESRPKWLSLIPNHKKAIIMVKAKAMVGFDLTKAEFEVNLENHSISISKLPSAEILSIEPNIEYYDLKDSALNRFKPDDYSAIQKQAVELIKQKVEEGELPKLAIERGKDHLKLVAEIAKVNGWKIEIEQLKLKS
jgi:hypothetical protein